LYETYISSILALTFAGAAAQISILPPVENWLNMTITQGTPNGDWTDVVKVSP
jgi:hypothetical protein